jgi:hypothetical protein
MKEKKQTFSLNRAPPVTDGTLVLPGVIKMDEMIMVDTRQNRT